MPAASAELGPGSLFLDRFEVVQEIGAGSFGRVYQARQLSTGQFVAVKVLRPAADGDVAPARFRRELQLCAAFSHPNIVRLMDSGVLPDERLFAIFEFVQGRTLREVLDRDGPLDTIEAVRLLGQVLDALSCAHAHGVVHRDLKPENVMITETGSRRNALVLDFGLGGLTPAATLDRSRQLTATREMMGTPAYAAPEQLRGERPTPASDLYSWGLVLLECLTGDLAVAGATAYEVLVEQLSPNPIAIPSWVYREGLGHVIERVTAKDPEAREASAADVLAMLDATTIGRGGKARVAPARIGAGERRQLTLLALRASVMRLDGGPVDLDDLEELLPAHHERVIALVERHGGTVIEGSTDRHLAMFGYPIAMENDARRAVTAARRIVSISDRASEHLAQERGLGLAVSAGVHSEFVVVRETAGSGGGVVYEIIGRAPDIVTRLAARGGPGEILASADTAHMLRGEASFAPVDQLTAADASRPLDVVRVLDEPAAAFAATLASETAAPLVERDTERAQIEAAWGRAREGVPATVLVAGEAGIGKSRLVRELRREVPAASWIECRCVPEQEGSPFQPIVGILRRLGDNLEAVLARFAFDRATALPLFARLLDLPVPEDIDPVPLAPDRQKELTIEHLVTLLARMAAAGPIAFVVEDVHWADPSTLEVLRRLSETIAAAEAEASVAPMRLLFLATARPEFVAPWTATHATVVRLSRLSPRGVAALVVALRRGEREPDEAFVSAVVERTDGNPLFVEEVVHAMVRTGADAPVPATIRELLAARLDSLSPRARTTVQIAAALGREFSWDLLRVVADREDAQLRRDLREIMNADLLHQRRGTADEEYLFRHALLRDATYESMAANGRAETHRRIAAAIESEFRDIAEQQPELVAHHLERARALAEAIPYWQRAGDRALRRANYQEATRALERALALLEMMPPSEARTRAEIAALTSLGTVQFSTQGYAAPEVERTFARAHALCVEHRLEADPKILSGIIGVHITSGNKEGTEALLPQFRRMAERPRDMVEAVTGWTTLAIEGFWRGDHVATREYLARARPAYRSVEFQRYARDYGYDGGIFSYAYTAWNEWVLGRAGAAEATYQELLALARHSFDPYSLPLAVCFGMELANWRRDEAELAARAAEVVARSTEQKLYLWLAVGLCGLGAAAVLAGKPAEGIGHITQGLDLSKSIGDMASYGLYLPELAAAHAAAGDTAAGLAVVEESEALAARALGRFHVPEVLRVKAVLLARAGDAAEAERTLRESMRLAAAQGAVAWRVRSALTLATLLREARRAEESTAVLAEVMGDLPAGADLDEIGAARALLAPA